jgi:hypothetical protein
MFVSGNPTARNQYPMIEAAPSNAAESSESRMISRSAAVTAWYIKLTRLLTIIAALAPQRFVHNYHFYTIFYFLSSALYVITAFYFLIFLFADHLTPTYPVFSTSFCP